jgi:uncharacterized protein (TIGR02757 family)
MQISDEQLKTLLDNRVKLYNQVDFIAADPITIPHQFSKKQDIEIAGLFAAVLAWGNRKSIINSCNKLLTWMDNDPHAFILHHTEHDLKKMLLFAHRTFNATDLLYFIERLHLHYVQYDSLESMFISPNIEQEADICNALIHFHNAFFSIDHPHRTKKHLASPAKKSACKRINMYLRWMVRKDAAGVDFGIWKTLKMKQLICPLDVHVASVANRFGLLETKKTDWQAATLLTAKLRQFCSSDPVKYDYALFGLGIEERF